MVRSRDDHGVDFICKFRQQDAVIGKMFYAWELCIDLVKSTGINVSEPNEFDFRVTADTRQIRPSHSIHTNRGNVQLFFQCG
jgi:hypothetical protein